MALGGPTGVRAYPQGEAPADDAWLATLELRYAIGDHGQTRLFHDNARGRLNHDPIAGDGDNTRRLRGSGLGLDYTDQRWNLQLGVAWREGPAPDSDVDRTPRVWLQTSLRF